MKQSDVDLLKSLLIKKAKMKSENGSLEIDNTAEGLKARIISLEGKMRQKTRDGYNKFDSSLIGARTINGVDVSINSGKLILNGTISANSYIANRIKIANLEEGTYTFILKKSKGESTADNNKSGIYLYKNNETLVSMVPNFSTIGENRAVSSFTISESSDILFTFYINTNGINFENFELELMIVEGTYTTENAPDFEEYGLMPSLGFESEILGITGDVKLKLNNTNYLDESKLMEKTTLGITTKRENGNITFDGTGTSSNAYLINSLEVELEKGNYFFNWFGKHKEPYFTLRSQSGEFIQNLVGSSSNNNEINVEEKTVYQIGLHGVGTAKYTPEDTCFTLMISKKNDEKYTEYQSQTHTVSLGSKILYGDENARDGIVLKNGKWNWKNCWKKRILDGTEFNFIVKSDSILNNVFFSNTITNILAPKNNNGVIKIYSNYFANNTYVNKLVLEDIVGFGVAKDSRIQFGFGLNSEINSLELANAKLQELNASGHPLYVIYQLAEPEYEEITDETLVSQLNKLLYNIYEYDDVTYINSGKEIEFEVLLEQDKLRILENT